MMLKEYLVQNRKVILEKWFNRIIDSYPADSSNFLRNEKNRFNNPVGYTISHDIEYLYDSFLNETDKVRQYQCLENIVRIRAVQEFSPSQAMAIVFFLKDVVREQLSGRVTEPQMVEELRNFDAEVDHLCLLGFDAYMKCREKIYEIKANEAKMRVYKLLERTNLIDRKSANED